MSASTNILMTAWSVIDQLSSNSYNTPNYIKIKNNGTLFENPYDVANIFNNFFLNIPKDSY